MSRWFADYEDFGKSWFLLRFFDTVKYLDFCKVWLNVWGDPHHLLLCVFLVCCKMIKTNILAKKFKLICFSVKNEVLISTTGCLNKFWIEQKSSNWIKICTALIRCKQTFTIFLFKNIDSEWIWNFELLAKKGKNSSNWKEIHSACKNVNKLHQ